MCRSRGWLARGNRKNGILNGDVVMHFLKSDHQIGGGRLNADSKRHLNAVDRAEILQENIRFHHLPAFVGSFRIYGDSSPLLRIKIESFGLSSGLMGEK